jgi:hypothetical protein
MSWGSLAGRAGGSDEVHSSPSSWTHRVRGVRLDCIAADPDPVLS